MTLFNLLEVTLKVKVELPEGLTKKDFQKVFDDAIKEIFTDRYYNKIKRRIRKIKIKNIDFFNWTLSQLGLIPSRASAIAYINPRHHKTVRMNKLKNEFALEEFKSIILHEFIHIIQMNELKREFKKREFIEHSKNISRILQENLRRKDLKHPWTATSRRSDTSTSYITNHSMLIDRFFNGLFRGYNMGNKNLEIVAYLIIANNTFFGMKCNWNSLKPGGKLKIIKELKRADIFNITSDYWKEILR